MKPSSRNNPQTARLGPHTVNRVGFGAMQLAGPGVFGPPADPVAARAVLRRAVELGADHIDTAQFYGPDVVNELIRDALHPYPAGLRLVSKVGARRDGRGAVLPAQHPAELRAGVEANLQTLRVDALALVNLRLMSGEARGDIPMAEQLGELKALRDEGKIESIGLSNATVDEVAAKHAATPAQIALAWLLHHDEHVLLIPGTSSVTHLEQNMAAAHIALDDEDLAALDRV